MISYCIAVYKEFFEIQRLLKILNENKNQDEEIIVIQTHKEEQEKSDPNYIKIKEFCEKNSDKYSEFKFENNFADLKNYLNSFASKDYILNIDADEYLKKESFDPIREIIKNNNNDLYYLPRINTLDGATQEDFVKYGWVQNEFGWINWPDFQPRLYKNNKNINWIGIVHETITGVNSEGLINSPEMALIHHKDINKQRQQNDLYESISNKRNKSGIINKKYRTVIGMCSWNNPDLLEACIGSILPNIDRNLDDIVVVLNESDDRSCDLLKKNQISYVSLPENRGVLAIDYLKPFIENSRYFLNTNDDMFFHGDFLNNLIYLVDQNYPASASCGLVENFFSNNPPVFVDESLQGYSQETLDLFYKKYDEGKYYLDSPISSYNHPILVKSEDFLRVGGYSGNWDADFLSGYARDDMFAYKLAELHNFNFKFICSNTSFVYHLSSETMKKLDSNYRACNHNGDVFHRKTGVSMLEFKKRIFFGEKYGV
jgi:GT2 family glycosyltransferase